jgi:hypothetical protein
MTGTLLIFFELFRLLHQEGQTPLQGLGLFYLVKSVLDALTWLYTSFYEPLFYFLNVNISSVGVIFEQQCAKSFTFLMVELALEGVLSSWLANLLFIMMTAVKFYSLDVLVFLINWVTDINVLKIKVNFILNMLLS